MTTILALDPSYICIGYARLTLRRTPDLTDYGAYKPRGKTQDEKLADACQWLADLFAGLQADLREVDVFAYERAVFVRGRSPRTPLLLAELAGTLRLTALAYVDRVIALQPGARRVALGLPMIPRKGEGKALVLANVNGQFGLSLGPKEHDVADAVAVALAAVRVIRNDSMDST